MYPIVVNWFQIVFLREQSQGQSQFLSKINRLGLLFRIKKRPLKVEN